MGCDELHWTSAKTYLSPPQKHGTRGPPSWGAEARLCARHSEKRAQMNEGQAVVKVEWRGDTGKRRFTVRTVHAMPAKKVEAGVWGSRPLDGVKDSHPSPPV